MYAVYRTTNTIILYLILSTISIFIPVSGGVGRGQVHCFAQGGGGGYNAVKTTLNPPLKLENWKKLAPPKIGKNIIFLA